MRFIFGVFLIWVVLQTSVWGQQRFYKIYFSEEGIYKITGQELADAGAAISQIQPQTIQLFSDGQRIIPYSTLDPLPELQEVAITVVDGGDGQLDPADYILFYGLPLNRFEWDDAEEEYIYISNPYSTEASYWLRWNVENGKRIISKDGTPVSGVDLPWDSFQDRLRLEEDNVNALNSGLDWTWNLFGKNNFFTHHFDLPGATGSEAEITARLSRFDLYFNLFPTGHMSLSINNESIGSTRRSQTFTATTSIQETANTISVDYIPSVPEDTLQQSGFDWMNVVYDRSTVLAGNELKVYFEKFNGVALIIYKNRNTIEPIDVFDISDPANVVRVEVADTFLFEERFEDENKLYFFRKADFARSVSRIEAAERDLFAATDGADYLVIAHRQMASAVEPLKMHRETHNGFTAKIVLTEDIFNEFGFGRPDPTAIRNFIRFAHENWNPQPQFIVLAGNGYFDYRNITGRFPQNWVPPFEISGSSDIASRAVDDFFVDIEFSSSGSFHRIKPQIPIGRLPGDTAEEIANIAEKIIASETDFEPGLWRLNALLIADDQFAPGSENGWVFLEQTEDFSKNTLPDRLRTFKLYESDFPFVGDEKPDATQKLIRKLNEGNRAMVFSGYGSHQQWTHENLLNFERDLATIQNERRTSLFMGFSNLYSYDDRTTGILQNLLKRNNTGVNATIVPNRPAFFFRSNRILTLFWTRIFEEANGFVGTALMLAKNGLNSDQKYHLLGDPATNISLPEERVQITSIQPGTLQARSLMQIQGQITGHAPGDSLILEIREPGKMKTVGPVDYVTTGQAIFRGKVAVNEGEFTAQFVVPNDVPHDSVITGGKLFAYTWNGRNEGMGFVDSIYVGGVDSSVTDTIPPEITFAIPGSDSAAAVLLAGLYDESGINLSALDNHFPMLFIDGNFQDTINVADFFNYDPGSFQSGILRVPLPPLSDGTHIFTLKIHDNFNNAAEDSVALAITGIPTPPENIPNQITLAQNFPNPFNPETTIRFRLEGSQIFRVHLEIFNTLGQKIRTLTNDRFSPGEYEMQWDGRSQTGENVASGIYIYRLQTSTSFNSHTGQGSGIFQLAKKMVLIR